MEARTDTDVLIIGAGPTGLVMAIELLRRGVSCRIVDKNDGPAPHSRAIAVQARTLELFEGMGVADEAVAAGVRAESVVFSLERKLRARIPIDAIASPYPFVLLLPQDRTERILLSRLEALGGAVERGTSLTALTQDANGVVATLARKDGTEETVRTRYLVGCDGAHSSVRHALGVPFAGDAYAGAFWLADVIVDGDIPRRTMNVFVGDSDQVALALPLDDAGRYRVFVLRPQAAEQAVGRPTLAGLQAVFDALAPAKLTLRDPVWLSAFRLHHRKVTRYRTGRVFIAGDAAHIHSPAGGQGMNTGIQDAVNLAWKLAFALRGAATPALLESYHAERDAVGAMVLRNSDRFFRLITTNSPVTRLLQTAIATFALPRMAVRRRFLRTLAELDIRYAPGTAVVRDGGGAGVKTGLRAPDGPLVDTDGVPTRLMPVMAAEPNRYTLLLFSGAAPTPAGNAALAPLAARVRRRYGAFVAPVWIAAGKDAAPDAARDAPRYTDPAGETHRTYGAEGAKGATAYLVRPDGYVAFRGSATDARTGDRLLAHLGGVFLTDVYPAPAPSGTLVA